MLFQPLLFLWDDKIASDSSGRTKSLSRGFGIYPKAKFFMRASSLANFAFFRDGKFFFHEIVLSGFEIADKIRPENPSSPKHLTSCKIFHNPFCGKHKDKIPIYFQPPELHFFLSCFFTQKNRSKTKIETSTPNYGVRKTAGGGIYGIRSQCVIGQNFFPVSTRHAGNNNRFTVDGVEMKF